MQIGFDFELHVILMQKKIYLQHTNMHSLCRLIKVILSKVSRISSVFCRMQQKVNFLQYLARPRTNKLTQNRMRTYIVYQIE